MKPQTIEVIRELLDDELTNASARIRALNSDINQKKEYKQINPDASADFDREIEDLEHYKAAWEYKENLYYIVLKDFNNALKS